MKNNASKNYYKILVALCVSLVLLGACKKIEKYPESIAILPFLDQNEQVKAKQVFGKIHMEVIYKDYENSDFPKLIERIVIISQKKGTKKKIAEISKDGFFKDGEIDISPAGFNRQSQFVKDYFIGFSLESLIEPFVIYGVARDSEGHIYETDPLLIWVLDYENQSTKLYSPEY